MSVITDESAESSRPELISERAITILVTHVFGYANKGDWMLLDSLLSSLRVAFPNAVIRGICRDPLEQARRFSVVEWFPQLGVSDRQGLARRIENFAGLSQGLAKFLLPRSLRRLLRIQVGGVQAFDDVQLIIACPGGYLEDSNVSIITNLVHLWMGVASGAPVIMAPQSIGPFRKPIWRYFTRRLLARTHHIAAHEEVSRETLLHDLRIQSDSCTLLPDMAYYNRDIDRVAAHKFLADLGLKPHDFGAATVLDWYFPFSNDSIAARDRYLQGFAEFAKRFHASTGRRLLLLKQVETTAGGRGDEAAMRAVAAQAPDSIIADMSNHRPQVMRGIIENACLFVGSRMHSVVFALQTGTPAIAIAYLPKTWGMMAQVGLTDFICDIEEVAPDTLWRLASEAMRQPSRFEDAKASVNLLGDAGMLAFHDILRSAPLHL